MFLQSFPHRVQGTFSTFAFFDGTLFFSLFRASTDGLFMVLVVELRVLDIWEEKGQPGVRNGRGINYMKLTLLKLTELCIGFFVLLLIHIFGEIPKM